MRFDKYLKRVAHQTTLEVSKVYPERLENQEHAMRALGIYMPSYLERDPITGISPSLMENVSLEDLHQQIFAPVRYLINGTGKSWRSYLAVLSFEVFGGNLELVRPLLASAEIVHTGTLIVDDVEDESPIRRGVPAVHKVWGTATAINAGEAALFSYQTVLQSMPVSPETRLAVLNVFFETMRLGHAGQGLDIAGQPQSLFDDIIAGRVDPSALEKNVLATHRLKTAIVGFNITRISGLLAGAPPAQLNALAAHMEKVGVAFQIIDDVHDIRRPSQVHDEDDQRKDKRQVLKRRGDDIRSGKISVPIAKAGQMMPLTEAKWIWDTVRSKPGDDDVKTQEVIDKLEAYGVVEACVVQAKKMMEDSWQNTEKYLVDNQAKLYIEALSRYMVEYNSV